MISAFNKFVDKEHLFEKTEKILLAVSGGIDSVAMCDLFHKAGFSFGIAHCNFQLRSDESEDDELFVETLAGKYNVGFHSVSFDTADFAKKNKLSIQEAARNLRYDWFEEIRSQFDYHYIATAHHQDDSIETLFINLIRGTGISGLHGILPKKGKLIRPLLFATKNDIVLFAKKNKLKYREDSSNHTDKYVRNKIRHRVIPVLRELNPHFERTMMATIERLKETETIYKESIKRAHSKVLKQSSDGIFISIEQLKKLSPINTYLFEFLKPYGYSESTILDIIDALDEGSGKQFYSATHRLLKDREFLMVEKIENQSGSSIEILKNAKQIKIGPQVLNFRLKKNSNRVSLSKEASVACLDFDKISFPLFLRKWRQGDVFYPLGMKNKKKLSDFFIDKKLSLRQKENTWLLTTANDEIMWIVGMRIDDRFKITDKTSRIYFAELV